MASLTPSLDVDVIVVNYLTPDLTRAAVERLQGPEVRLFVVDNSGELLPQPPPGCELLGTGQNTFYAAASDLAYSAGGARWVLLHNPDIAITIAQVQELREQLAALPEHWAIAPRLETVTNPQGGYLRRLPTLPALAAELFPPIRPLFRRAYDNYYCRDLDPSRPADVDQPAAACLLLDRTKVGKTLFDQSFPMFFNDTALSERMARAGWRCRYSPDTVVTHVGAGSIDRERSRGGGRWISDTYDSALLRYARMHFNAWWCLAPLVALRRLFRRLPRGAPEQVKGLGSVRE